MTFESFGVRVSLESDSEELLAKVLSIAETALLGKLSFIDNPKLDIGYRFGVFLDEGIYYLFQNGEQTNFSKSEFILFKFFNSMLRVTVAENAVNSVFIHAGVISWKDQAVIFPARSFKGKTSLVAELIKHGAVYFSDEYAVVDLEGLVHPFARDLSIRGVTDEYVEADISPFAFGAQVAEMPARLGCVILTEYRNGRSWRPRRLSVGNGILETIPHTIPMRADAAMSLKILNRAFSNAIIAKSYRGDVKKDAVAILAFLDKHLN